MLNVFLDHPTFGLWVFGEDKFVDVPQVPKQFNASALVQRSGFDEPHVLLAVLDGHTLFVGAAARYLLVASHEQVDFIVVADLRDYESGRSRIKYAVPRLLRALRCAVVRLQRANQARLCRDASRGLEVVQENGPRRVRLQSCVHAVVGLKRQIQLSPVEVTGFDGDLLSHLAPVATGLEGVDEEVGEVSAAASESIVFDARIRGRLRRRCGRGVCTGG